MPLIHTHRAIRKARRRLAVSRFLHILGWAWLVSAMLVALAVVIARSTGLPLEPWWAGLPFAAGVIVALVGAFIPRPGANHVAIEIDQRLGLKDRLATALFAQSRAENDPFARQVVDQAESGVAGLSLARAFPIRLTPIWAWLPGAAAVAALLWAFVPPMDLLGVQQARAKTAQEREVAAEHQAEIRRVVEELRTAPALDPATAQDLEHLAEFASLTERDLSNPQWRQDAAAELSDAERRLAERAKEQQKELAKIESALSRVDPETSGPADQFADALRRGDFAQAQQAMRELAAEIEKLSPEEREALHEQAQRIADQLLEMGDQPTSPTDPPEQQGPSMLPQDDQASEPAQPPSESTESSSQDQTQAEPDSTPQPEAGESENGERQPSSQSQPQTEPGKGKPRQSPSQTPIKDLGEAMRRMAQNLQPKQQGDAPPQQQPQQRSAEQAAGESCDAIGQMQEMREQTEQTRQSQGALRRLMDRLTQPGGEQQGTQRRSSPSQQMAGGQGGREPGMTSAPRPPGDPASADSDSYPVANLSDRQGRIIGSWNTDGPVEPGESRQTFSEAVTEARDRAEQAVNEDRVPRRYHRSVRYYFQQIPEKAPE